MRGSDRQGSDSGGRAHMSVFLPQLSVIPSGTRSKKRLQRTVHCAARR